MAKAESTDDRELIQKADELYEAGEWRLIYELLGAHRDSSNPDVLWRLARSARDVSQLADTSKEEKKRLTYEQVDISRKAVELGPNNYACHQVAVFLFKLQLANIGSVYIVVVWNFIVRCR